MVQVLLPAEFQEEHRRIALAYLNEGHTFSRQAWQQAVVAFDLAQASLYREELPMTHYLLAYCLYWWRSFTIDGDTLLVLLKEVADMLSDAVQIVNQGLPLTVIDYDLWKSKMTRYQAGR